MIIPLHRLVMVLVASVVLQGAAASPLQAREGIGSNPWDLKTEYHHLIARIIHTRMKNRWYRTLSGGVATLAFTLERDGTVSAASIAKTSGSPYIDALALASVPAGYVFPPFPRDLGARSLKIQVPLRFNAAH